MYLTEKQITENSIVVIDHEDGKQTPYFIYKKGKGTISKATLLIGWKLVDLISDPKPFVKKTNTERYYIGNKEAKGHNKNVTGYRSLKNEERVDLVLKIRNINELHEILDLL